MVSLLSFVTLALAGMVVASVGGDVRRQKSRMEGNLEERGIVNCSGSQSSFISDSVSEATDLATGAIEYIQKHGTDNLFTTYFGAVQDALPQLNAFVNAATAQATTVTCQDPYSICTRFNDSASFGAFSSDGAIFFCPSFWNQVDSGQLCDGADIDSGHIRGATVLQEFTAVLNHTLGIGGCSTARQLVGSPSFAAGTGDNYRCFAMQVYINTNCPTT